MKDRFNMQVFLKVLSKNLQDTLHSSSSLSVKIGD